MSSSEKNQQNETDIAKSTFFKLPSSKNVSKELEIRNQFIIDLHTIIQQKYGVLACLTNSEIPPPIPPVGPRGPSSAANAENYHSWPKRVDLRATKVDEQITKLPFLVGDIMCRVDRAFASALPADLKLLRNNPTEFDHVIQTMSHFKTWSDDQMGSRFVAVNANAEIPQTVKDEASK